MLPRLGGCMDGSNGSHFNKGKTCYEKTTRIKGGRDGCRSRRHDPAARLRRGGRRPGTSLRLDAGYSWSDRWNCGNRSDSGRNGRRYDRSSIIRGGPIVSNHRRSEPVPLPAPRIAGAHLRSTTIGTRGKVGRVVPARRVRLVIFAQDSISQKHPHSQGGFKNPPNRSRRRQSAHYYSVKT